MKKGSLNFFELHVEKIVVGLAGAFVLFMAWKYLLGSPNEISYANRTVGPGELDRAILDNAKELERRVDQAKPAQQPVTRYSDLIKKEHEAGILAAGAPEVSGPPLPPTLRLSSTFGKPAEIPGLKSEEESAGNVALIKPLRPLRPVLRTYRSMANKKTLELNADPAARKEPDKDKKAESVETVAVTVASYFDTAAQQKEMTDGHYATHRNKVYVAGVDVQRQEMLGSGEWSEWTDVKDSKAMPKLDLHAPAFDDQTKELVNKPELGRDFALVRQYQETLMQPTFYTVSAGDKWELPPLPGHEPEEDEDEAAVVKTPREKKLPKEPTRTPPRLPPTRMPPSGGEEGVSGPGGRGMRSVGPGPGGRGPEQNAGAAKAEGQKQAKADLAEARKHLSDKDYPQARGKADAVVNNPYASAGDKKNAKDILDKVERTEKKGQPGGPGEMIGLGPRGNRFAGPGGPGSEFDPSGGYMPSSSGQPATGPVTNPNNLKQVAVWFHDDSVESGKTYRYRMRVKLWNRYVGEFKALSDPAGAREAILMGDWSLPSEPLTVTPSTYFFVKGPRNDREAANVDVWKWQQGKWLKETFEVAVGDTIGGVKKAKAVEDEKDKKPVMKEIDFTTGAVVVDLRLKDRVKQRSAKGKEGEFDYSEKDSVVLVYLDPADGQIKEKVQLEDRYDPIYKKLQDEAAP